MNDDELHELLDNYISDCEIASAWLMAALEALDDGNRGDAIELLKQAPVSPWLRDSVFKYILLHV